MTPHLYIESSAPVPDDTELEQLTEYVGGLMTETQAEAFEARLVDDEGFFARVSPLLDAWYAPGPLPVEVEIAASWKPEDGDPRLAITSRRPWQYATVGLAAAAVLMLAVLQILRFAQDDRAARDRVRTVPVAIVPSDTPLTVPPVQTRVPKPVTRPAQVAVRVPRAAAQVPTFGESPADRALVDSIDATLPPVGFTPATVRDSVGANLAAVTVAAAPLDTFRLNAQQRIRDLLVPKTNVGAAKGGRWHWPHIPTFTIPWKRRPPGSGRPPAQLIHSR